MNDKILFLFGNGLSIALSNDFSLKLITERFLGKLTGDEKLFLESLCGGKDKLNFDNFEENFTKLEAAFFSLKKYRKFIDSNVGKLFLEKFHLPNPELKKHEKIIESLYNNYIYMILDIIHGNVKKNAIDNNLKGFTDFFIKALRSSNKSYVFTLNYDLLAETILLEYLGTENFTDFCNPASNHKELQIKKCDFDPAINEEYFEDYNNHHVELHHLHGSLSLFYDLERNKAIKFKSKDISIKDLYNKLIKNNYANLLPAIITGGGKSDKISEYPFEYYFREFKRICDTGEVNKIFVVGYSFRDEHINELLYRWRKNVEYYEKGLLIIDYKLTEDEQVTYKKSVKKALHLKSNIPDQCFIFKGVNYIKEIEGTKRNVKQKRKKKIANGKK